MAKQAKAITEARRRWGRARVFTGNPTPKHHTPAPAAPAAVQARRAA